MTSSSVIDKMTPSSVIDIMTSSISNRQKKTSSDSIRHNMSSVVSKMSNGKFPYSFSVRYPYAG